MSQLIDSSLSGQFDRLPPSAIEAEHCLIASMMLDKEMIGSVVQIIDREAFYQADHQILYDILVKLYEQNRAGRCRHPSRRIAQAATARRSRRRRVSRADSLVGSLGGARRALRGDRSREISPAATDRRQQRHPPRRLCPARKGRSGSRQSREENLRHRPEKGRRRDLHRWAMWRWKSTRCSKKKAAAASRPASSSSTTCSTACRTAR